MQSKKQEDLLKRKNQAKEEEVPQLMTMATSTLKRKFKTLLEYKDINSQ
jgi:hypothetical protein